MSGEETIFTWGAPPLKIGWGASDEIGFDLSQYGVRRVLILTDPGLLDTGIPHRIADRLRAYEIAGEIFAEVHVEPTDESMQAAIAYAVEHGPWDAFVAVGGGSAIDTAKAVNLLTTFPGELMDYLNAPDRPGPDPSGGAEAPVRRTHHRRHRRREHQRLHHGHLVDAGEDRDQPLAAAADDGRDRPGADHEPAARGDRRGRDGHPLPRRGVLHRQVVRRLRAQDRRAAGHLLRRQPDLGPVVGAGAVPAGQVVPASRARGRPGVADGHDDGRHLRRDGLRQRRCPPAARQRVPDRRDGQGVPTGRLPTARAVGAARDGGVADRARGVPVRLRRRARTASEGGRAAGAHRRPGARPGRPAADGAGRPDARHRHPQRHRGSGLHRGGRARTSCRAP